MNDLENKAIQALLPLFQANEDKATLQQQLADAHGRIAALQDRCGFLEKRLRQAEHQARRQMAANAGAKGRVGALLASLAGQGKELLASLDASAYDDANEAQGHSVPQGRPQLRPVDSAGSLAFLKRASE